VKLGFQGKYNVAPFGKSGNLSQIYAGQSMAIGVYAVDQFYNLDSSLSGITINADLPNDNFDITPSSLSVSERHNRICVDPGHGRNASGSFHGSALNPIYTSQNSLCSPTRIRRKYGCSCYFPENRSYRDSRLTVKAKVAKQDPPIRSMLDPDRRSPSVWSTGSITSLPPERPCPRSC